MMQGDPKIDDLMRPVNAAIRRHVKDAAAVTDIYNRAYEAVMEVQDALNVSAAVASKQIAENAKNLQRAEAAEARAERLKTALMLILDCADYTSGACGLTEMIGGVLPRQIIDRARDALKGGEE